MVPDEPPKTEELRVEQVQRADTERMQAIEAAEPAEEHAHRRRAEKAEYLARKLDEQAEALDE